MSAVKFGYGCIQLGAALFLLPLVVLILLKTAGLMFLMVPGALLFVMGFVCLLFPK